MSRNIRRIVRKLARATNAAGGFIWVCVDCGFRAKRLHGEGWARNVAVNHTVSSHHTVRVLELE